MLPVNLGPGYYASKFSRGPSHGKLKWWSHDPFTIFLFVKTGSPDINAGLLLAEIK